MSHREKAAATAAVPSPGNRQDMPLSLAELTGIDCTMSQCSKARPPTDSVDVEDGLLHPGRDDRVRLQHDEIALGDVANDTHGSVHISPRVPVCGSGRSRPPKLVKGRVHSPTTRRVISIELAALVAVER
jgi:hypothetical protein